MIYSDLFRTAVAKTLEHEGGWVNDPKDPGGATNWGISLRFLRESGDLQLGDIDDDGDIDAKDIREMTRDQAIALYHKHFWLPLFESLPRGLARKLFDACVNMGDKQAIILLQRCLNDLSTLSVPKLPPLKVDGQLGPMTLERCFKFEEIKVLQAFRAELSGFYRRLVSSRPRLGKFLRGWLRRAAS